MTAIGKALGKGSPTKGAQVYVAAQAAVQAFYFVTGGASAAAVTAIVNAMATGAIGVNTVALTAAANAGKTEAQNGHAGAGAPGIKNYGHFNVNNDPVTNLANF